MDEVYDVCVNWTPRHFFFLYTTLLQDDFILLFFVEYFILYFFFYYFIYFKRTGILIKSQSLLIFWYQKPYNRPRRNAPFNNNNHNTRSRNTFAPRSSTSDRKSNSLVVSNLHFNVTEKDLYVSLLSTLTKRYS